MIWIGNAEKNFYKRVPKEEKEVRGPRWQREPRAELAVPGLLKLAPDLAHRVALDSFPVFRLSSPYPESRTQSLSGPPASQRACV